MSFDRWSRDDRAQLNRVEEKLTVLVAEGEEEQDTPAATLDGDVVPGDRDQSQSLS